LSFVALDAALRWIPFRARFFSSSHSVFAEHHIAKISNAQHAFAVSSGMAALDVILRLLKPGDEVVAGDDLYGGTNRLLSYMKTNAGIVVHHVDTTDPYLVIPYLKAGKTAMVILESPTNPLLKIVDIATINKETKERAPNALVVVDNTMMSPYLQRPLEHGADVVYDSATKFLSGHHDLMAGVIACNRDDLAKVCYYCMTCGLLMHISLSNWPSS
jgi:cystathionine beta-lyase/cystathionine gamma-synthase